MRENLVEELEYEPDEDDEPGSVGVNAYVVRNDGDEDDDEEKDNEDDDGIDEDDYDNEGGPTMAQIAAITYFYQNQKAIMQDLCEKIYHLFAPDIPSIKEASQHFNPHEFFIHTQEEDGVAFLGMTAHCTWDEEHGFGVTWHKKDIRLIGEWDYGMYLVKD